jgi:hypothetical protein
MVHTTILTDSDISFINLIDEGFPLNYIDSSGDSLLTKAVKYDSRRVVKQIIEREPTLITQEMIFHARSLYVFDALIRNGNISVDNLTANLVGKHFSPSPFTSLGDLDATRSNIK